MIALILGILFAIFSLLMRFLTRLPNVVPVGALALWSGVYLSKKSSLILPLAVMFLSDALIGFYDPRLMISVYGSIALISVLGWRLKAGKNPYTIVLSSLFGSVAFFIITNTAVWLFSAWYPHDIRGLLWTYVMGMPFFRNTLLGDIFYNAVFFSAYALVRSLANMKFNVTTIRPSPDKALG